MDTEEGAGRPRVTVTPDQVKQLRNRGANWRRIAKALRIGHGRRREALCDADSRAGYASQNHAGRAGRPTLTRFGFWHDILLAAGLNSGESVGGP